MMVLPTFQQYVNILRKRKRKTPIFQKIQEWDYATTLTLLIYADQHKYYSSMFQTFQDNPHDQSILLNKIHIIKASTGLLCKCSFLPTQSLSLTEKYPILLHPKSYLTT